MDLQGRVALVTGSGHRVGRELALALARRGMRVAVHYHSSDDSAADTVAQIGEIGGAAMAFRADLAHPTAPERLISEVVGAFGSLDVLVNSAAIMKRIPVGTVTYEDWDSTLNLNLRAPFFLSQAAAPHLRKSRGVIVNIADLAAFETWPAYVPHGISKAGVVYMTRALASVLAPEVRVNGIAPGVVLLPNGWSEEGADHLRDTTPVGRLGSPADVVQALEYLLDAEFVTGETILVDGGRHVRR